VTVNGVDYQLSPLGIKSLTTIQKEALRFYKRQYLETFADTIDLVSNGEDLFLKERQIVAKWSYDMLPASVLHDPDSVLVTDELREKLTAKLGELPSKDDLVAALCCLHFSPFHEDGIRYLVGIDVRGNDIDGLVVFEKESSSFVFGRC
jgi:hypothetical protein